MFKQHKAEMVVIDENPNPYVQFYGRGVRASSWPSECDTWYWGNMPQVTMSDAERAIRMQVAANMGMAYVEPEPSEMEKYCVLDVDFTVLEERVLAWHGNHKTDLYAWAKSALPVGEPQTITGRTVSKNKMLSYMYGMSEERIYGLLSAETSTGRIDCVEPNFSERGKSRVIATVADRLGDKQSNAMREQKSWASKRNPRTGSFDK